MTDLQETGPSVPSPDDSKVRVAVVFGGRSGEHTISCATAAGVLSAIDRDRYEVLPVGITPEDDGESISFNLTAAPGDGSAGARIPVDGTMFHDPRDDSSNPGLSDLGSVYGRIALRDVAAISAPGATVLVLATGPGYLGRTSVRLYGVGRGDA